MTQEQKDYIDTTLITIKLLGYDILTLYGGMYEVHHNIMKDGSNIGVISFKHCNNEKNSIAVLTVPQLMRMETLFNDTKKICDWTIKHIGEINPK